jgi:glycosyltransferase involved in cell wall biosynthesis
MTAYRPLRVLQVFGVMNRGGAELRTLDVMRRLDPGEFEIHFCVLTGRAGSLDPEIIAMGGRVHRCRLGPTFALKFLALLARERIDVVHSHVHFASGLILWLARLARVRVRIAHFRSTQDDRGNTPGRRLYRRMMRRLIERHATAILAVGTGVMEVAWPGWRSEPRCQVIPNGLDPADFETGDVARDVRDELQVPETAKLVLMVGRFDPPKNYPRAARVLAALRDPSVYLVIAGRGRSAHERAFLAEAAHHGVVDRIHLLGERRDVPRLMNAADVLLLTSTREGLPGAVLEAVAAGTPVVASDLPGVREIAAHLPGIEIRGLDEPDACWASALEDSLRAGSASSRGEARARFGRSRFSLPASVDAHATVWRSARR